VIGIVTHLSKVKSVIDEGQEVWQPATNVSVLLARAKRSWVTGPTSLAKSTRILATFPQKHDHIQLPTSTSSP